MQVTFYGVRGSIPAPGRDFIKYGGNTACVHVKLSDGTDVILDSGTGIKVLGQKLVKDTSDLHLLLTHNHWDHIQGFPFFLPAYQPQRKIYITPGLTHPKETDAILEQMSGSFFPIGRTELQADIQFNLIPEGVNSWTLGSAVIQRKVMNHPGGGSSYVIRDNGATLAYVTDNELFPPYRVETQYDQWQAFVEGADLLIHDAQYDDADMPLKHGWGHSLIEQAVELAIASNVKTCALYSHDHTRTDDQVDEILAYSVEHVKKRKSSIKVIAAYEGLSIKLA